MLKLLELLAFLLGIHHQFQILARKEPVSSPVLQPWETKTIWKTNKQADKPRHKQQTSKQTQFSKPLIMKSTLSMFVSCGKFQARELSHVCFTGDNPLFIREPGFHSVSVLSRHGARNRKI